MKAVRGDGHVSIADAHLNPTKVPSLRSTLKATTGPCPAADARSFLATGPTLACCSTIGLDLGGWDSFRSSITMSFGST